MSGKADRRRELKAQYKARKVTGGVYRIVNRETGRFLLDFTDDMQATHNWFGGCLSLGSCEHPRLREEWSVYGAAAYAVEELDLLEKPEEQTLPEFRADLKVLCAMWDEKLPRENRY